MTSFSRWCAFLLLPGIIGLGACNNNKTATETPATDTQAPAATTATATVPAEAAGEGVQFLEGSWKEAMQQAATSHKYLFVDVYASWCGPCKMLKKTTFKDKAVADFFNSNFINFSIDAEQGEGPELASGWAVDAYPTLMVIDEKGNVVLKAVGFLPAEELLKFGQQALAGKKS